VRPLTVTDGDVERFIKQWKEHNGPPLTSDQQVISLLYELFARKTEVMIQTKGVAPSSPPTHLPDMEWLVGPVIPVHEVDYSGTPNGLTDGVASDLRKMVREMELKEPSVVRGTTAMSSGTNTYSVTVPAVASVTGLYGNRLYDLTVSNPDAANRVIWGFVSDASDNEMTLLYYGLLGVGLFGGMRGIMNVGATTGRFSHDTRPISLLTGEKFKNMWFAMTGSNNAERSYRVTTL
jgi:hypothetical protein